MSRVTKMLPAIFPKTMIVKQIVKGRLMTIWSLCQAAGIGCRVTGPAARRKVYLRQADRLEASREPGPFGRVSIGIKKGNERDRAILALGVLA